MGHFSWPKRKVPTVLEPKEDPWDYVMQGKFYPILPYFNINPFLPFFLKKFKLCFVVQVCVPKNMKKVFCYTNVFGKLKVYCNTI